MNDKLQEPLSDLLSELNEVDSVEEQTDLIMRVISLLPQEAQCEIFDFLDDLLNGY